MLIGSNSGTSSDPNGNPMQLSCSCQTVASSAPSDQPATKGDLAQAYGYLTSLLGLSGLGDDPGSTAASGGGIIDWSFLGGSTLTALLCGIGFIIAAKTVFAPKKKRRKKWAAGAWRDEDYEETSSDYGVRPARRRRAS